MKYWLIAAGNVFVICLLVFVAVAYYRSTQILHVREQQSGEQIVIDDVYPPEPGYIVVWLSTADGNQVVGQSQLLHRRMYKSVPISLYKANNEDEPQGHIVRVRLYKDKLKSTVFTGIENMVPMRDQLGRIIERTVKLR